MMLTRQKELARIKRDRELRRISNQGIKIYNSVSAMRSNPYANDTTLLPFGADNRTDKGNITEDDVLESVLFAEKYTHRRKDITVLCPDLVSDEVKEQWLDKIRASVLRNARAGASLKD